MVGLANGARDVVIPETKREDEIGDMARALTVFQESARQLADMQRQELTRTQQQRSREAQVMRQLLR